MWLTRLLDDYLARREARLALREFRRLAAAEEAVVLKEPKYNPVLLGRERLAIGDEEEALRHWEEAVARFPDYVARSFEALCLAIDLRLFDEAERLAAAGRKRRPPDPLWFEASAELADRRGDVETALTRWSEVRKRFPALWLAWVKVPNCLRSLDRPDEAEAMLTQAIKRFPDRPEAWIAHASLIESRGVWSDALERWNRVEELFPRHADGPLGAARALDALGRPGEAESRLKAVRHQHPSHPDIIIPLARHAARRGDWEAAALAWQNVRERWPHRPEGYHGGREALAALGRHDEADQIRAASP